MAKEQRSLKKTEKDKKSLPQRMGSFFSGLRTELKRVIWPDRKSLQSMTLAVLAISIGVAILVYVVDSLMVGVLNLAGFNRVKRQQTPPVQNPVEVTEPSELPESETSESTSADTAVTTTGAPSEASETSN
ncbi:MAG: preprotein translocase subunit SecE [Eubacteriales bacterium]|nr:preprotein translocase subunit SecE [Eubacteriales bacterium]